MQVQLQLRTEPLVFLPKWSTFSFSPFHQELAGEHYHYGAIDFFSGPKAESNLVRGWHLRRTITDGGGAIHIVKHLFIKRSSLSHCSLIGCQFYQTLIYFRSASYYSSFPFLLPLIWWRWRGKMCTSYRNKENEKSNRPKWKRILFSFAIIQQIKWISKSNGA